MKLIFIFSSFFDDIRQTFIFYFQAEKIRDYSKKINAKVCGLFKLWRGDGSHRDLMLKVKLR